MTTERLHYGDDGTIHRTSTVNVERDPATGAVVAVWFRCLPLPFTETVCDAERAEEMRRMYAGGAAAKLLAVDVEQERAPR